MVIKSTGTVNGISRTVSVQGNNHSVFTEWAFFATISSTLSGKDTRVNGALGTDGPLAVNSGADATAVNGAITFYGINPTITGDNVHYDPDPIIFPTVAQVASASFPLGGLDWL